MDIIPFIPIIVDMMLINNPYYPYNVGPASDKLGFKPQ